MLEVVVLGGGPTHSPRYVERRPLRTVSAPSDRQGVCREGTRKTLGRAMLCSMVLALLVSAPGVAQEALVRQVQEDLQAGKYTEASEGLQQLVKAHPNDPVLWRHLGLAHARLNETDAAIAAFQRVLSIAPGDSETCFNLGSLFWAKGEMAKALRLYQRGLKVNPMDIGANQNYALLLMQTGKYREAIEPLRRVKEKKDTDLQVRVALIESCVKGGMVSDAEKETKELLKTSIASPSEKTKLAALLIEDKSPSLAEEVLRNAVDSSPNLLEGHALLGKLLLRKGSYEDAVWELGRAVQLDADSPAYSMEFAQAMLMAEYYKPALDFLKAVEERFGDMPEYRFKLGLAYYGLHSYPQTITELGKVLNKPFTRMDFVHYFLADSYLFGGDLTNAEVHYRKAIELNPNNHIYYLALGSLLRKAGTGREDEAIQDIRKAMELDPSDPEPKIQLALCYERGHDLAKSQALLEEVVRSRPEMARAHITLARVYYRLGRKADGEREKKFADQLVEQDTRRRQMHLGIPMAEAASSK